MARRPAIVRRWTVVDGCHVHSRETAGASRRDTAPMVMVHGLGVSSRYFVPLLRTCERSRAPAVAPDLPGIGHTPRDRTTGDLAGMAGFLARWLTHRWSAPAVVLGNSLGAQVAVELAVRRPELVSALVLVGPTVDPSHGAAVGQLVALLRDVPRERPQLSFEVAADVLTGDLPVLARRARAALDDRVDARVAGVTVPTLVIRGTGDPLVSEPWARRVAELAGGELVELDGGHALHHEMPDAVARVVAAFLR